MTISSDSKPAGGALPDLKEQKIDGSPENSTEELILLRENLTDPNRLNPVYPDIYDDDMNAIK